MEDIVVIDSETDKMPYATRLLIQRKERQTTTPASQASPNSGNVLMGEYNPTELPDIAAKSQKKAGGLQAWFVGRGMAFL